LAARNSNQKKVLRPRLRLLHQSQKPPLVAKSLAEVDSKHRDRLLEEVVADSHPVLKSFGL
jgi:hypothetical protein